MNKELSSLEVLNFIETALNDNHFYKRLISKICDFMELDIKPFEDLVKTENAIINYICDNKYFRANVANDENKLKAFEIIKKKWLDFELFERTDDVEVYNNHCLYEHQVLTQEEFDLLREALK